MVLLHLSILWELLPTDVLDIFTPLTERTTWNGSGKIRWPPWNPPDSETLLSDLSDRVYAYTIVFEDRVAQS